MKTVKIEGREIRIISTYMRERRRENWSCIEEEAEKYKGIPIIVGGDFNTRTAEKEVNDWNKTHLEQVKIR